MKTFERKILAMAIAAACLGVCAQASAGAATEAANGSTQQQTDNDQSGASSKADKDKKADEERKKKVQQLETVEVSGFRSSQVNSIATKRNSDQIVEAVSAEQIGKLPGVSIADTLGRLPGLAVQTLSGRPQVVSIHGLGPDFSTALVNGREQVSTSNNRDVQYDQYPSSWFNSVVVHLSPSANLLGQGLSGTVDMRTIRPLEQDHRVAALNAHYVKDSMGQVAKGPGVSDKGYQFNGVYVDQFADHTFGVTLGIDFESNPAQILHQAPWGYPNTSDGPLVVGGSKNYAISDSMKRSGFLATLQWQPNDNYTSTLDMTYDNFRETQQLKGAEFPLFWGGGVTLEPGDVKDNMVMNGTWHNVKAVLRNDYNKTRAKVYNFGWKNELRFNEDWTAAVDASYSRAAHRDTLLESYSGTGYGVGSGATDDIGFTERGDGLLYLDPTLDYSSDQIVLTDPQGWGGGATPSIVQAGFINAPRTRDYLMQLKLSVQRDFVSGPISSVQFGVNRGTRDKTYFIDQSFLTLPNGDQTFNTLPIGAKTALIPGYTIDDPLGFMGVGPQIIYDPIDLLNSGVLVRYPTALSSIAVPPNWHVRETDVTPYLQFNVDTSWGNVPVRGNFGVQVAHTSQNSEGQRVEASAGGTNGSNAILVPIAGGTSYTRWLPSGSLVFGLTESTDLRVGAARVMARARMDQMSASIGLNTNITHLQETDPNQSYFSASGGNAKLLPTMADNYNISLERYFGDGQGYAALSAYYLSLKDYINPNAAYEYDFAAFVDSYLTPEQQALLGTTHGIVSGPTNDGHGHVQGVQATLNTPLNLLTPALDGFGVILSGSYTKSEILFAGNSDPITVPGLSKRVFNNTIYYEHNGFQARIGQSYRSSFLGEVAGISATRIEQTIKGGSTYDAQISYTPGDGPLKGMTFLLQGSNLSDKKFITFQNHDPRQVQTWEQYGRRYVLGVSYKFD
ncbi:MAG TPA: TonB-dependent receptor [Rhodanobacteraceae bacterium]|nr:TonB-dependent receptor [Rhodanobacteraceae bacterium]